MNTESLPRERSECFGYKHRFLFKEETHQIVGCAMEILNTLGHGLLEKPYENAMVVEFGLKNIPVQQQPCFDVL